MHRMEACRLRPCRCRLEEASRSEIGLAGPARNAFTPHHARGELRPREKPLEGAILRAALSIWILAIELTFLGVNSTRPAASADQQTANLGAVAA